MILKVLNWITNNHFLKQKIYVPEFNGTVRKITDNWLGSSDIGKKIVTGKLNPKKELNFNKFNFLRDLKAEGSIKARSIARSLVNDWIDEDHNLQSKEFNSETMSARISCWSFNYSWFVDSGKLEFQKKILRSIALQTKYLELKLLDSHNHLEKIIIVKGIIIAKSILYDEIDNISNLLVIINDGIIFLTNPDGGHKSRNPVFLLNLLRHLIEIRSVLAVIKNIDATNLHAQVIKMGEFLRSFQMPNGYFAWFFGGSIASKEIIKQTLNRIGYKNRIFSLAKETGFSRIMGLSTTTLVDIGTNQITNASKSSLFAFEFFYQKNKIISNLGELKGSKLQHIKNSLASSAAHSTLNIDDRNNIDLFGRRKTRVFNLKYGRTNNGTLLDITHSGYETLFGVHHRRQIYISNKKEELRGKDEIINVDNIGTIPKCANIRFHIHPQIDLIKTRNGSVLLNHIKGFVWKMSSNTQNILLQDSIMFTNNGNFPCKQIVINVKLDKIRAYKKISCNWTFQLQSKF